VVLVLSACGGGGDKPDAASGEPQAGGSLSLIQMTEARILDPAVMTNALSGNTFTGNALFGALLTDKADGAFDYGLAKSLETSDGGTTWKLTLRDGLTFSDGSPLDAEDVVYNWNRIKDPQLGSGSRAIANYIKEMKADGQTLDFDLTEPVANFAFAVAAQSLNWIAKPEALEAGQAAFDKNPVGAGPFVLDSWARGGKMVLKKNAKYFDKPRPYLDELVLTANGDEGQRFATVKSGGADATASNSSAHFKRGLDEGLQGLTQGLSGGTPMWLNTRFAPFDDPRAREAVAKGIDLQAVSDAAYEGKADIPRTLFTKKSPLYTDTPLTGYDKVAAQKLLDELADEGKPVKFTITAYQTSESRRVAEAMQAQLSAYDNIDVKLEVLDFPAAIAKGNAREFQMMPGGAAFADPETLLYEVSHTGSAGNYSGISDPQLDAALEKGRMSSDLDERKAAYADYAKRLSEVNPFILYQRNTNGVAFDKSVSGFVQYGTGATRVDGVWKAQG